MLDWKKVGALVLAALTVSADAGAQQQQADEPEEDAPHADAPHGGHGANPNQPPEDMAMDAPGLPNGQLQIMVVSPENKPLPGTPVTLGIVYNTVAKGESRKRLSLVADDKGVATVDHLEGGSAVAYRPSVVTGEATFAVMPFRMPEKGGMRAILHVYPVVSEIESALIVSQSVVYAEVKDDRVQIQQALRVYNFGKNAWVPKDLVLPLPEAFTAFTTQQGMSDIGVDAVPKKGVKVHGTFGPGQHNLEWRWQLPYSGEAEVRFSVGMAPHMAGARVIAPASKDMTLEVPGFPQPQSTNDGQGQRALITEKQAAKSDQALKSVEVIIRGLPTEGPAKVIATLLSGAGLLFGLVLGTRRPSKADRKAERARLLDEIEQLERARLAGDVGPKTYERARRELLEALARTFVDDTVPAPVAAKKRSKSAA